MAYRATVRRGCAAGAATALLLGSAAGAAHADQASGQEAPEAEGAVLEWTGNDEVQHTSPFGENFLSAGIGDGTEETYRSEDGTVRIVQEIGGEETEPDYGGRAAHIEAGGTHAAVVSGGAVALDEEGAGSIAWEGAWTVNFYDGLVPFSIIDPVLTLDDAGSGALTAALQGVGGVEPSEAIRCGYSEGCDPDTDLEFEEVGPYEDVEIATFSGAEVDLNSGAITLQPDYEGVQVEVQGESAMEQTTQGEGWGSWPQSFVDFHMETQLSSYWYSSGGAADPRKAPHPVSVSFDPEAVGAEEELDAEGTSGSGDADAEEGTAGPLLWAGLGGGALLIGVVIWALLRRRG